MLAASRIWRAMPSRTSLGQTRSIRAPCHAFIREIPRWRRRLLVERLTLEVIPLPAAQLGLAVVRQPSVQELAHRDGCRHARTSSAGPGASGHSRGFAA